MQSKNRRLVRQRVDVEASSGFVISLEEGRDEVVEGSDDGGGVDSKLAVISLPFIEVDADVDMEVFVTLDVAMTVAAAAATLRAALILFCLLQIVMPSR